MPAFNIMDITEDKTDGVESQEVQQNFRRPQWALQPARPCPPGRGCSLRIIWICDSWCSSIRIGAIRDQNFARHQQLLVLTFICFLS